MDIENMKKNLVKKNEDKEPMKPELRKYMTSFNDQNTRIAEDTACRDKTDIDMKNSMMFSNLLNLAAAYNMMYCFDEAV